MTTTKGHCCGHHAARRLTLARRLALVVLVLAGAYISGGCGPVVHTETLYAIPQADGSVLEVRTLESASWDERARPETAEVSMQIYVMGPDGEWDRIEPYSERHNAIASMIYRPAVTGCGTDGACYDFQPFGDAELGVRPKS